MLYVRLFLPHHLQICVPRRQPLRELPLLPQTPLRGKPGRPLSFPHRPELLLERRFRLARPSLRVSVVVVFGAGSIVGEAEGGEEEVDSLKRLHFINHRVRHRGIGI